MQKRVLPARFRVIRQLLATPFIWMMIVPTVFSDILLEVYHRISFPLYGIPCVSRGAYIRILDRSKLPYLSLPEKLGCMYCGYVNGWLRYATEVAARTERYWCGIKHLETRGYIPGVHEASFSPYGDEPALTQSLERTEQN